MPESAEELKKRLAHNNRGMPLGMYSVCSAHRTVIEAALLEAGKHDGFAVIESTSNQVDQFGGYTGLTPARFVDYVKSIAVALNFPARRILFGGDHLGPNAWQREKAQSAMEKARTLVRAYTEAGFEKIHLDASMFCADDPGDRKLPLADKVAAERTAELCGVCEEAARHRKSKPLYIIGTEVPIPGGAREEGDSIRPSSREGILETLEVHQRAFFTAGLADAWERVIAVVAQPGVEFSDHKIFYYNRAAARELSGALENTGLVFEAHSTDYQRPSGLREMVEDHFCILKVGPWLTFRYREAVFSLARIEAELIHREEDRSKLEKVLEKVMLKSLPNYWEKHYHGSDEEKYFARRYSLSDRSRYYWTNAELSAAVKKLFDNLTRTGIPYTLVSQYMPNLIDDVSEGSLPAKPRDLTIAHIRQTLALYGTAAGFDRNQGRN
ncbi:MAG: class II D-tagatose-bisphosphate aldolase, non-catalytic subunit [Treponema sp.]|jgi:D-tagatose-1,6-bisphosphate aldolase subunit GatZ/KbaZ|nr:class II D-tagatose-bisphosphate aldolase, non-catalytic subunit [Treponema sp.]